MKMALILRNVCNSHTARLPFWTFGPLVGEEPLLDDLLIQVLNLPAQCLRMLLGLLNQLLQTEGVLLHDAHFKRQLLGQIGKDHPLLSQTLSLGMGNE